MGVKGLWSLLNPVARPVQIESLEGKRLAIDSSIWLYQFQATMRDKDGRVLVNAHVLGFLRRINKLIFHGIKPVFVFDGGAPALKRATIAERKRRKAGAAANHARMAEKLFAAQMRREAVKVAQTARDKQAARTAAVAASRYADEESDQIPENAVYLEDLEGRPGPSVPRQDRPSAPVPAPAPEDEPPDPREERRKRFRKHDPYRLPEASMPTVSTEEKPDARLATEEELKQFIDEMRPSDIDIESAEFRALPTEVQYEIIGDLRIRSRQQSHKRLTEMLRRAPSALDFSQAQIKHLAQRNALTQQLLTVTDMVGSAHLTIPVRIAAERNREYVLVKRGEEAGGGWALGIREGTKANPIEVDKKAPLHSDDEDSDEDSESGTETDESEIREISPPATGRPSQSRSRTNSGGEINPRDKRRREVLDALTARYAPPKRRKSSLDVPVKSFGAAHAPDAPALFEIDEGEVETTANDEALAIALQQEELGSDEDEADPELVRALALSRQKAGKSPADDEEDDIEFLEQRSTGGLENGKRDKGEESDESMEEVSLVPSERSTPVPFAEEEEEDEDEEMEEVKPVAPPPKIRGDLPRHRDADGPPTTPVEVAPPTSGTALSIMRPHSDAPAKEEDLPIAPIAPPLHKTDRSEVITNGHASSVPRESPPKPAIEKKPSQSVSIPSASLIEPKAAAPPASIPRPPVRTPSLNRPAVPSPLSRPPSPPLQAFEGQPKSPDPSHSPPRPPLSLVAPEPERLIDPALVSRPPAQTFASSSTEQTEQEDDDDWQPEEEEDGEDDGYDDGALRWSRSPSPTRQRPALQAEMSTDSIASEPDVEEDEGELAAEDVIAEKDDYARFMAQIKNRDLNEVRTEIDDEIRVLHNQAKVALRDSDEITQAMISQIQTLLRHFGIPYITAPMEAEAQCAKLAQLGLVDGIITDDSDVFLFGGVQCFKNIFNDAKYAECFLLADIDRELSLSRDRLISLAYLLGSDYTIGLPGVGPVVALELLANFPGARGVDKFKEWWMRVQRGQDLPIEADTKWKVSFKRYAANIFLTSDWPNPLVREAYKYPTTDESEEPFHWGFPKLSALRAFLHEELSWSISKVDDELTPIVQRIARRGKAGSLNVQGTLDPFFDTGAGSGNYAPRRRTTANVSKRLMAVIKSFREAEARVAGREEDVEWGEMMQGLDPEDPKGRGTGKRRRTSSVGEKEELEKMDDGDEEGWERRAAELAAKEESSSQSATPAPKRKRAPARKKSQESSVAGGEDNWEDGEAAVKKKKAPAKRKARTSSRGEISKDPGETEGLEVIPPKDMKERRAQQKKWRRTVVAGSLNR